MSSILIRRSLLVLALGLTITAAAVGGAAMKAAPTAVAVVDAEKLFDQLTERQAIEADIRSKAETLQQQERDKKEKIQQMQGSLDMLNPGTKAFQEQQAELEKAVLNLQVWVQYEQQKLNRQRQTQVEGLFKKVLDAIERVSVDEGYDAVLFQSQSIARSSGNSNQPVTVPIRIVAWNKDSIDLTDRILTRMNNEYSN